MLRRASPVRQAWMPCFQNRRSFADSLFRLFLPACFATGMRWTAASPQWMRTRILCAFAYADLFKPPAVLKGSWWHSLLLVNNFYPPAVYAFNGLLKMVII